MELNKDNRIGQGNTAEIFNVDDHKVLKLFRTGWHQSIIEQEFANGRYVQKVLDCVPQVYEMIRIQDRSGIVYEKMNGVSMLKQMLTHIWKLNLYSRNLARYHHHIHQTATEGISLEMRSVKELLLVNINRVELISEEEKMVIRQYLKELPEEEVLCHMDFHPGNIMLEQDQYCVLDWMTAGWGSACADVARTCLILKYGSVEHLPWLIKRLIKAIQYRIYREYFKEYLRISGQNREQIDQWELPLAAARLLEWTSEEEKQMLLQLVNTGCDKLKRKEI